MIRKTHAETDAKTQADSITQSELAVALDVWRNWELIKPEAPPPPPLPPLPHSLPPFPVLPQPRVFSLYVRACVCACVCVCVCAHTHTHTRTHIYSENKHKMG